jgi:methylthioribose-1-phosphate isomerase
MKVIRPVYWEDGAVKLLDQTRLPHEEVWLSLTRWEEVAEAIRKMRVRGAPAIGIAAAYALALAVWHLPPGADPKVAFRRAKEGLADTRPTAVNLFWSIQRMEDVFRRHWDTGRDKLRQTLLAEAQRIHEEDIAANRRIGAHGAELLPEGARVLTICNTGALATGGYGTALGVIRSAWEKGKIEMVYACETRPRLQGTRLTAWELLKEKIPFRLIADSAAGFLMARGEVNAVLVGADRIAKNGDTANKIGTYTLAVLARRHGIPFYVVAPTSTVDLDFEDGEKIPIEERGEEEVLAPYGMCIAPEGARAHNPAFDLTPAELITAIVTELGVLRPPYRKAIADPLGTASPR